MTPKEKQLCLIKRLSVGFWIGLNPVEVMLTQGTEIAVALTLGIVSSSISHRIGDQADFILAACVHSEL